MLGIGVTLQIHVLVRKGTTSLRVKNYPYGRGASLMERVSLLV